jgi:hypothetical protein
MADLDLLPSDLVSIAIFSRRNKVRETFIIPSPYSVSMLSISNDKAITSTASNSEILHGHQFGMQVPKGVKTVIELNSKYC